MAYYYVKFGGTATGDGGRETTKRTGAWSANSSEFYATVSDCITQAAAGVGMAAGDFILCSDAHDYDAGGNLTWSLVDGVSVFSVSNTNQDQYSRGAKETAGRGSGDSYTMTISGPNMANLSIAGMELGAAQHFSSSINNGVVLLDDCGLTTTRTGNTNSYSFANQAGQACILNCCDLVWPSGVAKALVSQSRLGSKSVYNGCTFAGGWYVGSNDTIFTNPGGYGSGTTLAYDCDFSGVSGGSDMAALIRGGFSSPIHAEFGNCLLPAGLSAIFPSTQTGLTGSAWGCSSADGYFEQTQSAGAGFSTVDISTYNNAGATYDGSSKFSISLDTNGDAGAACPGRVLLAEFADVDLSIAKTVAIELDGGAGLLARDVFVEVLHTSASNLSKMEKITSRAADILSGATSLTGSAAVWTGGAGNAYKIELNIPVQSGVDNGRVAVFAGLALANETVNFDLPQIGDA